MIDQRRFSQIRRFCNARKIQIRAKHAKLHPPAKPLAHVSAEWGRILEHVQVRTAAEMELQPIRDGGALYCWWRFSSHRAKAIISIAKILSLRKRDQCIQHIHLTWHPTHHCTNLLSLWLLSDTCLWSVDTEAVENRHNVGIITLKCFNISVEIVWKL